MNGKGYHFFLCGVSGGHHGLTEKGDIDEEFAQNPAFNGIIIVQTPTGYQCASVDTNSEGEGYLVPTIMTNFAHCKACESESLSLRSLLNGMLDAGQIAKVRAS